MVVDCQIRRIILAVRKMATNAVNIFEHRSIFEGVRTKTEESDFMLSAIDLYLSDRVTLIQTSKQ